MARSDLAIFSNYGYRDIVDKAASDFFGEQIEDAATVAKGAAGDGLGTGVGDGQVVPATTDTFAAARAGLAKFGISPDGGQMDQILSALGPAASSPDSYSRIVAQALTDRGYDPGGVGAEEIAGYSALGSDVISRALAGDGSQDVLDQVIAAHAQALAARGQAVFDELTAFDRQAI